MLTDIKYLVKVSYWPKALAKVGNYDKEGKMIITGEYWIRTLRENECEILNQSFDVMMLEEVLGEIVADPE